MLWDCRIGRTDGQVCIGRFATKMCNSPYQMCNYPDPAGIQQRVPAERRPQGGQHQVPRVSRHRQVCHHTLQENCLIYLFTQVIKVSSTVSITDVIMQ